MTEGDDRSRALDRAVQALARRDHSTESLRAKLDRTGISEQARADAVETLARAGYLDDARFARSRAEHLAARGYGDLRIRADLAEQGVEEDVVGQALATLEPEAERAVRQYRKLGGGVRALRSLARQGFSEESLEGLVSEAVAEEP